MRKIGRYRRRKQKKIIVIGSLSILLFLCVGYAAFSTSLNLKAKGNIKFLTASQVLRKECNTETGDGLYKDIYEEGKCVYKGANPNNYILFNNEMWRMLSLESDNTLKIIRSSSTENRQWDFSNNDFETSDIKEYLNANTNAIECGNLLLNNTNKEKCIFTNWIYSIVPYKGWLWTITGGETNNNAVYSVHSTDGNVGYLADYFVTEKRGVAPVVYLKNSTALSGDGTKENSYVIIN